MTFRRRHSLAICLPWFLAIPLIAQWASSSAQVPQAIVDKATTEKERFVDGIWKGEGQVLIGRVHLEDPSDAVPIVSRTRIFNDGYFAAALHPSRELCFRAHGYEPLNVPPASKSDPIVQLDDLVMRRTRFSELAQVSGRITGLEETEIASVVLRVDAAPPMWQDDGHECTAQFKALVHKKELSNLDAFVFSGLSPIPYEIEISSPGCNTITKRLTPERASAQPLGDIELVKAKRLVFTYISQFTDLTDLRTLPVHTVTIICDGDTPFLFTDQRDDLGNKLALRLTPKADVVEASFFYFSSSIYDLGVHSLEDIIDSLSLEGMRASSRKQHRTTLQVAHAYFFECTDKNAICIFSVTEPE